MNGLGQIREVDAARNQVKNPISSTIALWGQIQRYRWPIWLLFKRDLVAPLKKTALGNLWSFVLPLVPIGAYLFLRIFIAPSSAESSMHPALYVSIGVTLWFLMVGALNSVPAQIRKHAATLAQSSFPLYGVILSGYASVLFETLIRVAALVPVIALLGTTEPSSVLAFFALLLIPIVFFHSLGILYWLASLAYPDLEQIVEVVLRYLIFLSFAIFPITSEIWTNWIYIANPFAILIENLREMLVNGSVRSIPQIVFMGIAGGVTYLGACFILYNAESRLRSLV